MWREVIKSCQKKINYYKKQLVKNANPSITSMSWSSAKQGADELLRMRGLHVKGKTRKDFDLRWPGNRRSGTKNTIANTNTKYKTQAKAKIRKAFNLSWYGNRRSGTSASKFFEPRFLCCCMMGYCRLLGVWYIRVWNKLVWLFHVYINCIRYRWGTILSLLFSGILTFYVIS